MLRITYYTRQNNEIKYSAIDVCMCPFWYCQVFQSAFLGVDIYMHILSSQKES